MFEKVRLETFHINLLMGATIFDKHYIIQWKTDIMLLFNILPVQWFFFLLSVVLYIGMRALVRLCIWIKT